jgi:hypothetical protein
VIQKHVVNKLSELILAGRFTAGDVVDVRLDKRGLIEFAKGAVTPAETKTAVEK